MWDWLSELTDPEIPVVTLREMGILRQVQVQDDHIAVTITPTVPSSRIVAPSHISDAGERPAHHGGVDSTAGVNT